MLSNYVRYIFSFLEHFDVAIGHSVQVPTELHVCNPGNNNQMGK